MRESELRWALTRPSKKQTFLAEEIRLPWKARVGGFYRALGLEAFSVRGVRQSEKNGSFNCRKVDGGPYGVQSDNHQFNHSVDETLTTTSPFGSFSFQASSLSDLFLFSSEVLLLSAFLSLSGCWRNSFAYELWLDLEGWYDGNWARLGPFTAPLHLLAWSPSFRRMPPSVLKVCLPRKCPNFKRKKKVEKNFTLMF